VYRVVVTREGDDLLATVPSLPGAHTFAQTMADLDTNVREVVVLAADLPADSTDSFDLDWDYAEAAAG
jgi:predicted RNase H-like HicB family nuclease